MNIGETTLFDNATSQTTRVINTNWFTYLSLNGSNDRNNITYQTITNTPNLSNGNTVWPATLELYLLVDLKENDEITVKSDIVDGLAPNANPPYFRPVPNGNVNTVLTFESICTKSLVPSVQTVSHYNSTLTVPLDGKLDSALEFPVEGEVDFGDDFEIVAKKLVYRGERKQKFLVRGALNLARLTLNFPVISPPLAPPVITLQGVGFAVGVNGAKQNEVKTLTNMYTDLRYNFKWIAEENAENVVEMKQGDVLSFLVWSNNASYMTEAPDSSRSLVNPTNPIPNFTPPQGSTSSFTGLLSFVISKLER
jgi:hypothetical protein